MEESAWDEGTSSQKTGEEEKRVHGELVLQVLREAVVGFSVISEGVLARA